MKIKLLTSLRVTDRGQVHAYIGDGKGKTTTAVGVAVRAAGNGWKVLFLQFLKSPQWPSGERASLKKLGVTVRVMGAGFYKIRNNDKPKSVHRRAALAALRAASAALRSHRYQLVILDELGTAVEEGLLKKSEVEKMFKQGTSSTTTKPTHLIWTGHKNIPWMLKNADLVTDMKKVRHPFDTHILAIKGLDY